MKEIGGYFEIELNNNDSVYHNKAIAVNSARNALEYILRVNNYNKLYIPYYTCEVLLQPLVKLKIEFEFYHLDENFYPIINSIKNEDVLFYVNYFGIMNHVIDVLKDKFENIIVDNAQAFYAKPLKSVSTIYSTRKFFGLPDGGFVYPNNSKLLNLEMDRSYDRISHLISRAENKVEEGYDLFKINEAKLDNLPLRKMSVLTRKLLKNNNFDLNRKKRNVNFNILHLALKHKNQLTPIIEKQIVDGPMVYPYLNKKNNNLRERLIENKVFVAKYWPNVVEWLNNKECFDMYLYNYLIPLPIDQRYGDNDMGSIC